MIKFYNRESELEFLEYIEKHSGEKSQMTVITGRRRVGKTALIKKFIENKRSLYFFVARKDELFLTDEFLDQVKQKIDIPVFGKINSIKELFELLIHYSKDNNLTVVFDEFQDFQRTNPSIFSDIQNLWDANKDSTKMNLILCGSVLSMMKDIFENSKEPLFGRANHRLYVKPFSVNVLKNILTENSSKIKNFDLLSFYILTGGIAKYVEFFIENECFTFQAMINEIFKDNSLLINEGKNNLIEEFGKDYSTYYSILSLISSGKTSRSEIESVLQRDVGGFLDKLENNYDIIKKYKPVFSKPGGRLQKYLINDNFLDFWFRFIYKYSSALEIGNYDYIKNIVNEDFRRYSGKFLEKYFREKLSLTKRFSQIGSYWEKGNQNEIDIVALNERKKYCLIADVKLDKNKLNLNKLKVKADKLTTNLKDYEIEYKSFSLEDM